MEAWIVILIVLAIILVFCGVAVDTAFTISFIICTLAILAIVIIGLFIDKKPDKSGNYNYYNHTTRPQTTRQSKPRSARKTNTRSAFPADSEKATQYVEIDESDDEHCIKKRISRKELEEIARDECVGYKSDTDEDYLNGYDDERQDLLDFIATVDLLAKYKNRYTALQNATFVANLIAAEYEKTGGNEDFFDFVLRYCEKMAFNDGGKGTQFKISEEIAKRLEEGESTGAIANRIVNRERSKSASRPDPEKIYPLSDTGNPQIDQFFKISKKLVHRKVHHLPVPEKECEEETERLIREYNPREGKSFYDFFTHAFQFGYLKEKRFNELYFMLYAIASGLKDGLSEDEIDKRLNDIYAQDAIKSKSRSSQPTSTRTREDHQKKTLPYTKFTEKQHSIISISTRVSRKYYYDKVFQKTGQFATEIVNKYHSLVNPETSEKSFYEFTLVTLKKEQKKYEQAYRCLLRIVELVFEGVSDDDAWTRLCREKYVPILETEGTKSGSSSSRSSSRTSSCPHGKRVIMESIDACRFPSIGPSCKSLVDRYDQMIPANIILSDAEYYSKMSEQIRNSRNYSRQAEIVFTILKWIQRGVLTANIREHALSAFPAEFQKPKSKKSKH